MPNAKEKEWERENERMKELGLKRDVGEFGGGMNENGGENRKKFSLNLADAKNKRNVNVTIKKGVPDF